MKANTRLSPEQREAELARLERLKGDLHPCAVRYIRGRVCPAASRVPPVTPARRRRVPLIDVSCVRGDLCDVRRSRSAGLPILLA